MADVISCGWCPNTPKCKKVKGGYICPSCNRAYGDPLKESKIVATDIELSGGEAIKRNFNVGTYLFCKKPGIPEHLMEWIKEELKKGITCPKTGEKLNPLDVRWTCKNGKWSFKE
jgi:hypothetical protein